MIQDFNNNIANIKNISLEEKKIREESLNSFLKEGFPNKKNEDWKFTDLNKIILDNFKELNSKSIKSTNENVELIKDFEHNNIIMINGILHSHSFKYENAEKIKIKEFSINSKNTIIKKNSLVNLNDALFEGGFSLEINQNYRCNKPLIIYNYFSKNLENVIINSKNSIKLNIESSLDLVEYNFGASKFNFVNNNHTNITIGEKASLKNYTIQGCKSNGFFYKFIQSFLKKNSNYEDYIFSSGLKFNKIEENIEINGENANCTIKSGLFLNEECQQEIKTLINHLKPNSKSYQKIKNVLSEESRSAYQGKIFVKDVAQKTDAYQLSKALLLNDTSEFNAKPELEIYADDVKCSHGSTSGSINQDSIYYLMTRGLAKKEAIELLTKAFLFEVAESISNPNIKNFVEKNLNEQIYGY